MKPDTFAHKSNLNLVAARDLAESYGHAQIAPVHLALALLSDLEGIRRRAVAAAAGGGSENVLTSVERAFTHYFKIFRRKALRPTTF